MIMSSVAVITFGKRLVERFMKQTVLQITAHCLGYWCLSVRKRDAVRKGMHRVEGGAVTQNRVRCSSEVAYLFGQCDRLLQLRAYLINLS
jgi:hypothetical protein